MYPDRGIGHGPLLRSDLLCVSLRLSDRVTEPPRFPHRPSGRVTEVHAPCLSAPGMAVQVFGVRAVTSPWTFGVPLTSPLVGVAAQTFFETGQVPLSFLGVNGCRPSVFGGFGSHLHRCPTLRTQLRARSELRPAAGTETLRSGDWLQYWRLHPALASPAPEAQGSQDDRYPAPPLGP